MSNDAPHIPRRRSSRGGGAQLREELLQAARTILADVGSSDAVTIRRVAAETGVSQAAVYLHFLTRDELIYEVAFRAYETHQAALEKELSTISDARERIRVRGVAYMTFGREQPTFYRILFMGTGFEKVPERFEAYGTIPLSLLGSMVDDVTAAMDGGQIFRADPRLVSCVLWMCVHGQVSLQISSPGFPWPPREYLESVMLDVIDRALTNSRR